jgi:hypothetical protein
MRWKLWRGQQLVGSPCVQRWLAVRHDVAACEEGGGARPA